MDQLAGWVGTQEALAITGVSPSTLYLLRLTNKIAIMHVGRTVLYSQADCERVRDERQRKEGK